MNLIMSASALMFVIVAIIQQTSASDRMSITLYIDGSYNVSDWVDDGRAYRWKRASLNTGDQWRSTAEKQLNDIRRTAGAANMYYTVNIETSEM